MSVIAWDGKTLAADRASFTNGTMQETGKSIRLDDGTILAWSGNEGYARSLLRWFCAGEDPDRYPAFQLTDDWVILIVVRPGAGARPEVYYKSPATVPVVAHYYAWGAGAELALGAMAAGADARRAVEIACLHEASCGFGVDVYEVGP